MKALEQYFYQKLILYQMIVTKWSTNDGVFFVAASDNQIEVLRTKKRLNEFTLIDIKTCHGAALFPPRRRHVPNFL